MFYYPFDKQKCHILIKMASASKEQAMFDMKKSKIIYLEERFLPDYEVSKTSLTVTEGGNNETLFSVLEVSVVRLCLPCCVLHISISSFKSESNVTRTEQTAQLSKYLHTI